MIETPQFASDLDNCKEIVEAKPAPMITSDRQQVTAQSQRHE